VATVAASDAESRYNAAEFRQALRRHLEEHAYPNVKFIECTDPRNNPDEQDYLVAYEAIFEPRDLEHAYLKISVTRNGCGQIGFETRSRLAQRLDTRLWTAKKAFAAGRELASINPGELVSFVRLVAGGKVKLQVGFGFSFRGFGSTRAVVSPEDLQSLGSQNPRSWDWLEVLSQEQSETSGQIVIYKPW
jgi:hypothetical protein